MTKVVVIDDHDDMRKSLVMYLEMADDIEIVGEASDAETASELVHSLAPDVILLDLRLGDTDGIEFTSRLRGAGVASAIIGLSMFRETDIVDRILEAGADAYVEKMAPPSELLETIRNCAKISGTER